MSMPTPMPTILVAEDDSLTRTAVAAVLRGAGYGVLQAATGAAALALANRCDLLLLALRLPPPVGGVAVLDAVRRRRDTATLPIIILTGSPTIELPAFAAPHTISAILLKPVEPAVLLLTVESVLRQPRAPPVTDDKTMQ